jgi:hypothetical protein
VQRRVKKVWGVFDVYFSIWLVENNGTNTTWSKDPRMCWKGTEEEANEEAKRVKRGPRQFAGMGEQAAPMKLPDA